MIQLVILAICCQGVAQIPNSSYENWETVSGGLGSSYPEPEKWNTSNELTSSFGLNLVTEDTTKAKDGNSSIKLETQQQSGFTVPGIATNGNINTSSLSDLQNASVESLVEGGSPFTMRAGQLNGYYTYNSSSDTFIIFVRLTVYNDTANNREVVAEGTYEGGGVANSFTSFSLELTYQSCKNPDSMVIGLAASNSANAMAGTTLNVDSLTFSGSAPNFAPSAVDDRDTTVENQDVTIAVSSNDEDCDGNLDIVETVGSPSNGSASENNGQITYSPDSDFNGKDTVLYRVCDDGSPAKCDTASVYVTVQEGVSVQELDQDEMNVNLYPIPAYGDEITLSVNPELIGTKLKVFNLFGKELVEKSISSSETAIDISDFRQGIYLYHITDQNGQMLMRERFNIVR